MCDSVVWLIQAVQAWKTLSISLSGMTGEIRLQKPQTQIKGALHAQADTGHRERERESDGQDAGVVSISH